jgi:DNA-binding transcriptional regulator YhcF (GntR family)
MGSGATVIARRQEYLKRSERETMINDMVEHLRVEAYHLGFDEDYIINLLDQRRKEGAG